MTDTAKRVDNSVDNAVDNSAPNTAVMIVNGGTLRRGNPGNKGGKGRRPDRIKKLAQQLLQSRVPLLAHFADGVAVQQAETADGKRTFELMSPTPSERIRAIEALHKIGMGEQVSVSDVRQRLKAQLRVIREMLPPEQADAVCAALGDVWR